MRLCDVTQFYSPFGGGVKRYLTEKRAHIEARTDDEHVLIIPGARDTREQRGRLVVRTLASPPVSLTSRYRVILREGALRQALREERPDLVECGDPYHVAWWVLREADRLGVPCAGFYHSHFPEAYLRTAARLGGRGLEALVLRHARDYVRRLYNHFDATLVCAEPLRRVLRAWGVRTVRAVSLGADMDVFRPGTAEPAVRARMGAGPGDFLVGYVGRLVREKNVHVLVEALRLLAALPPPAGFRRWRFALVGQGPLRGDVERLASDTGSVYWHPTFGEKQVLADFYRAVDLLVHPSVNETFGLVPVEAQACGRLVAGIRGGNLELNIRAGLEHWARENSPRGLASALRALADDPRRAAWAEDAARQVRSEFAWPVVFEGLWGVYRDLLRSGRTRSALDPVL